MALQVTLNKVKTNEPRKLPFLPRIDLNVEVADYDVSFKGAPLLETILMLKDKGFKYETIKLVAQTHIKDFQSLSQKIKELRTSSLTSETEESVATAETTATAATATTATKSKTSKAAKTEATKTTAE